RQQRRRAAAGREPAPCTAGATRVLHAKAATARWPARLANDAPGGKAPLYSWGLSMSSTPKSPADFLQRVRCRRLAGEGRGTVKGAVRHPHRELVVKCEGHAHQIALLVAKRNLSEAIGYNVHFVALGKLL